MLRVMQRLMLLLLVAGCHLLLLVVVVVVMFLVGRILPPEARYQEPLQFWTRQQDVIVVLTQSDVRRYRSVELLPHLTRDQLAIALVVEGIQYRRVGHGARVDIDEARIAHRQFGNVPRHGVYFLLRRIADPLGQ